MTSLIEHFHRAPLPASGKEPIAKVAASSVKEADTPHAKMENDLRDLAMWMARVYKELPEYKQKAVMESFSPLDDQLNHYYRLEKWDWFQITLTAVYRLFRGVQVFDKGSCQLGGHWIYETRSRLLDANIWLVCCQKQIAQLLPKGVKRGSIYTEIELKELVAQPRRLPETLQQIHMVKACFEGVIMPHEKSWSISRG